MKVDTLRAKISKFPKLPLSNTPTPIQSIHRLQSQISSRENLKIWIKRDDEIGPGLGGNKGRKLDFLMAEAVGQNKTDVVTFGGLQSNHARMTAAACAALGLQAHLFFFNRQPQHLTGNLLLNDIFGAKMHFIPIGGGSSGSMTLDATNRLVRIVSLIFTGVGAYFIPVGGHTVTGCLGYVEAACELLEQLKSLGLNQSNVTVVVATGTGGTLAGLLAGFSLLECPVNVLGIDIGKLWKGFPASIAQLTTNICIALGENLKFEAKDIPLIEKSYVGEAYAHPSQAGWQAIRLLAQTEGILLDPVYTGKALAGMIDLLKQGLFDQEEHIIFLHSGGFPALGV